MRSSFPSQWVPLQAINVAGSFYGRMDHVLRQLSFPLVFLHNDVTLMAIQNQSIFFKKTYFHSTTKTFSFIQRLLQFYSTVPPMITFHKLYKLPTLPPLKAYALLTTVSLNVTIFYGVNKDSSLLKWLPLLWLPLLLMTKSVQRHTLFKHILSILKPRNLFQLNPNHIQLRKTYNPQ